MTTAFGRPRHHFRKTDSTNARARDLAEGGAPSGTVVTADEQTAGRGRRGRRWSAPPRSALLCSAILSPLTERHRLLPLAVPTAVCEAIDRLAPVQARVKWPNDVWIDEKKAAGVLIEARPPDWAVIGVGLNLSIDPQQLPRELRWPATSVGHGVTTEAALNALTEPLARWVDAPASKVLDAFGQRDALRGRSVRWERSGDGGAGIAAGVDDAGNLLVRERDGEVLALGSGEVQLAIEPQS